MRACRPSGAVRYTNRLYFGLRRLVHPLGRREEKGNGRERVKRGREFFFIISIRIYGSVVQSSGSELGNMG